VKVSVPEMEYEKSFPAAAISMGGQPFYNLNTG
jgi:hypothetical protein